MARHKWHIGFGGVDECIKCGNLRTKIYIGNSVTQWIYGDCEEDIAQGSTTYRTKAGQCKK